MVEVAGRNGPHNACCYRHLCKAESAAYLRIAEENERLRAALESICDAAATKPLMRSDLVRMCEVALGNSSEPQKEPHANQG
jgi:AmiR/NasT family two-component response regulator